MGNIKDNKLSDIDVIELASSVLKQKKKLFSCLGISGVIGLIVALCTPKVYTASVVLAPEISSGGLGMSSSLLDMAANFGIELGSSGQMDAIYPEIYPDIFASTDFARKLFDVPVRLENDNNTRTYVHHLQKETKIPFWTYPMVLLKKIIKKPEVVPSGGGKGFVDPFRMSKTDWEICQAIIKLTTCSVDKKTSEITISFSDQDPMVAAIMADTLQLRLQNYIIDYRTKKARYDYAFYDKLAKEALSDFKNAQKEFSSYSDSHMNSVFASISTTRQTKENRMSESYTTYSTMKQLRDQAKNKIQERTPAFTIIQSAQMPYKPSSRPKIVTLIIFLFIGCIVDVLWVLYEKNFTKEHQEIK